MITIEATMSDAPNEMENDGVGKSEGPGSSSEKESSGKEEKPDYLHPAYQAHRAEASGSWFRREEEDDGSQYFMSEPSMSEEGSEDPTMHGLALLSPHDSWSGDSPGSPEPMLQEKEDADELRGVRHQTPPPPPDYPNSPGGNTSLSSRESPFWPRKFHFMAYPPGESDQSWAGSVDGQRSRLRVDSTSGEPRLVTIRSRSPPLKSTNNETSGSDTQQIPGNGKTVSNNGVKKSPHSNSSSTSDGGHNKAHNFLKNLKLKSLGALRIARHGDHASSRALDDPDTGEGAGVKSIMRSRGISADSDQQKKSKDHESAEDKRQRRKKGSGKQAVNHRRSRSGDDVAALIMTGGTDFRGMEHFPAPPLFGSDEEEEEGDESRGHAAGRDEQRRKATPAELAMEASAGFAEGSFRKNLRPSRKLRNKPVYPRMSSGQEYWGLSDSTLSTGRGLDGENSASTLPSFVDRRSSYSGSISTLEIEGTGRRDGSSLRLSTSDRNDGTALSPPETTEGAGRQIRRTSRDSIETFETSSADSQASSKFSWISHSVRAAPRDSETPSAPPPPHPPARDESQEEDMFDRDTGSSEYESSYGSGSGDLYSSEDEEPFTVQQNRQQQPGEGVRFAPSDFSAQQQKVLRPHHSPFANIGKTTKQFFNKESYAPTTLAADSDKYPTFICPRCKTRQREFFSISTAPAGDSAAGYLAFYFFIYVIAALYIFGLQEGWNALDCVYFAVITLTTAGLGDFVPTSDGAKVICSIFIYFGVACIGLLLGSYLAGSLDEASSKEAQANRADSCPNCLRMKALKATSKVSSRRLQPSVGSVRVSPLVERPQGLTAAKMFRSERAYAGPEDQHQAVYERAEKRHKHHHFGSFDRSEPHLRRSSDSSQSTGQFGTNSLGTMGGSNRGSENQSLGSQSSSDGNLRSAPSGGLSLGVIDQFASKENPGFSSPAAPRPYNNAPASPSAALGSPVTANILHRQKHTRHSSLDIGGVNFLDNNMMGQRQRLFSEDIGQRISPTIYEDQPAPEPPQFSLNDQGQDGYSEDDLSDTSDSSSTVSDSSEASILVGSCHDSNQPVNRVKTAKYVFLTLKQALVNSLFIIAIGSTGFYLIEKMTAIDSFYFTTVLLTTVGYGDIVPVTAPGKLFATVYVLVAGTVLLHNMSTISMIPLELRKRRIERAVLTQFGDQLDDSSLRELATGSLVKRLQLSSKTQSGLDECTREMFALAMLVRLGKVTEHDVRMTFAAFRRLDVGNDGVLNSQDIIVGMMQKRRQASVQNLVALEKQAVSQSADTSRPWYFFGSSGSMHTVGPSPELPYQYTRRTERTDPEHESLLHNSIPDIESTRYSSMNMGAQLRAPAYDPNFAGVYQPTDLENGYEETGYEGTGYQLSYGTRNSSRQGQTIDGTFC